MRKAQEDLAKQKEVIMAQDKELKVNTVFPLGFNILLKRGSVVSLMRGFSG